MIKFLIIFLVFFSKAHAHSAWTINHENAVKTLNANDTKIFNETLISCEQYKKRKFYEFHMIPQETEVLLGTLGNINHSVEKAFVEGYEEGMRVFTHTRGLGMHLYQLLDSQGFLFAMKKCFNGNDREEGYYVYNLLVIDAIVKGIAMRGAVGSIKYLAGRAWGRLLIIGGMSAHLSGDTPTKVQTLTFFQRLEKQVKDIEAMAARLLQQPIQPPARTP